MANGLQIGLYDADSHNFPNLVLMKISAYHKQRGDSVEMASHFKQYDKLYVSKVFGNEYSQIDGTAFMAKEIICGGTGYAIKVVNGKEVYNKMNDNVLPPEIEHIYPDYSLYPDLTKDTAYGFLTRGCPNDCSFCIVSKKEGRESKKVADLSEFWNGQKYIKLLDPNLLACKNRIELLEQLAESGALIDFTQGLDARFITVEIAEILKRIRKKCVHFAFDFMKNEEKIKNGLKIYKEICEPKDSNAIVYMLTNFDTTIQEDLYRINIIKKLGYLPDVRIYRKPSAPRILKDMQRWCNNRILYRSCDFMDYVPRKDGKTIKELYFSKENLNRKENV